MTKGQIDDIVKTQVLPGSTIFTSKIFAFPKLHRYKAKIAAERFVIEKFYCTTKAPSYSTLGRCSYLPGFPRVPFKRETTYTSSLTSICACRGKNGPPSRYHVCSPRDCTDRGFSFEGIWSVSITTFKRRKARVPPLPMCELGGHVAHQAARWSIRGSRETVGLLNKPIRARLIEVGFSALLNRSLALASVGSKHTGKACRLFMPERPTKQEVSQVAGWHATLSSSSSFSCEALNFRAPWQRCWPQ